MTKYNFGRPESRPEQVKKENPKREARKKLLEKIRKNRAEIYRAKLKLGTTTLNGREK